VHLVGELAVRAAALCGPLPQLDLGQQVQEASGAANARRGMQIRRRERVHVPVKARQHLLVRRRLQICTENGVNLKQRLGAALQRQVKAGRNLQESLSAHWEKLEPNI